MIGFYYFVILDDLEDDLDGVEVEFFIDFKVQKFKEFFDIQFDDEIEKYEGYVVGIWKVVLNLLDGGNKFIKYLESLWSEKYKCVRKFKWVLVVCFCC